MVLHFAAPEHRDRQRIDEFPAVTWQPEQKFRNCRFRLVNYTLGQVLVRLQLAQLVDVDRGGMLFATCRTARPASGRSRAR